MIQQVSPLSGMKHFGGRYKQAVIKELTPSHGMTTFFTMDLSEFSKEERA